MLINTGPCSLTFVFSTLKIEDSQGVFFKAGRIVPLETLESKSPTLLGVVLKSSLVTHYTKLDTKPYNEA